VHYLVHAFILVLQKYPESELFIAGGGEPTFVEELKKMASPYPQIRFCGRISEEGLPNVYTSADVFCLVPLSGSTPTVLAEAMASGLPIISTLGSGSGEEIKEYDAGFLVEPGNIEDLAQAMSQAIENRDTLHRKARHALAASRYFSWDHIAQTLVSGYGIVLRAHRYYPDTEDKKN
jgi:glycosyltransferase involved in cell wall biosynthesis